MGKLTVCVSVLLMMMMTLSESRRMNACCTRYHESPIPVRFLRCYTIQEATHFCNIKAVIFKTVKGRFVCANPDSVWVQQARESVPEIGRHLKK
ncbi:C-C motif chemokine 20 [Hippoglossus stenolepis]|uniref:C-C motif chemokine 20 n=1 Tax=Hippoglossus stenolepis TaxID=195615 RepID=UPI00159C47FA|nr:C-C motif chemokine 20 [Hippoglossus stenolepis]